MLDTPSIMALVGRTPLVELGRLSPVGGATLYAKLELHSPGGAHEDRAAAAILLAERAAGRLPEGAEFVAASAGNLGISLSWVAARLGLRAVIVAPQDARAIRKETIRAHGAVLVLTPLGAGLAGAVEEAARQAAARGAYLLDGRRHPALVAAYEALGAELAAVDGVVRVVASFASEQALEGVARGLPAGVVLGAVPAPGEVIEGADALGPVPGVALRPVTAAEAAAGVSALGRGAAILAGPSAGAAFHVAQEEAARLPPGARVVVVVSDTGERYFAPNAAAV